MPLRERKVLLISGGGIAAYKAPLIVRHLQRLGAKVRCVLTESACSFVAPLALQALTHCRVGVSVLDPGFEEQIGHIELARWPDVILIAPATANLIARMAGGQASDLATTVLLATRAPVVVAPAMNTQMLAHPATQENLARLARWGHTLVQPDHGQLACEEIGAGRQPDPEVLAEALIQRLAPSPLAGQKVLITAGPTRAHIDPVRFISNPSTGRMGVALARTASWLGAEVTLVSGPVASGFIGGVARRIEVETSEEMAQAVLSRAPSQDWVVKSAAVSDWRPVESSEEKRKKTTMGDRWVLEMVPTTDILRALVEQRSQAGEGPKIVGFAAETHDLERHAREKLARKGCDALVANWVRSQHGDTFGSDRAQALLLTRQAQETAHPVGPGSKLEVALELWLALIERLGGEEREHAEA